MYQQQSPITIHHHYCCCLYSWFGDYIYNTMCHELHEIDTGGFFSQLSLVLPSNEKMLQENYLLGSGLHSKVSMGNLLLIIAK